MLQSKIEKPDRTGDTVSESKSHKFLSLALHKNVGRFCDAKGEPDAYIQEMQPMRQQDTKWKYLRMHKKI